MKVQIEKYIKEREKGIGFSEIRKQLTRKGFKNEDISEIIRQIDSYELRAEKRKKEKSKSLNNALMGLFIFSLGSGVTVYSYFSGSSETVLWYGAILFGLAMFLNGIIKYNQK